MGNVIISAYVPTDVAKALKTKAANENRTVSKVAGKILALELARAPWPTVRFVRRGRKKGVAA